MSHQVFSSRLGLHYCVVKDFGVPLTTYGRIMLCPPPPPGQDHTWHINIITEGQQAHNKNSNNNPAPNHVTWHQQSRERKPSQQSYRIRSRRALRHSAGPTWTAKTIQRNIKRVAFAYTTSRGERAGVEGGGCSSCSWS